MKQARGIDKAGTAAVRNLKEKSGHLAVSVGWALDSWLRS